MYKLFWKMNILIVLATISACASRGVPVEAQSPVFSQKEYVEMDQVDGRRVYLAKEIQGISQSAITESLKGKSNQFQLVESSPNTFRLRELDHSPTRETIIVLGNRNKPTLVGSTISGEQSSVLLRNNEDFFSNRNTGRPSTQYAH